MDYVYLRAWNRMMGSAPYFCADSLAYARKEKAPATAIYRRQDFSWATYEEIARADTKALIDRLAGEIQGQ